MSRHSSVKPCAIRVHDGNIVSEAEAEAEGEFLKLCTFYSIFCKFETALKINSVNLKTRLICPKGVLKSCHGARVLAKMDNLLILSF